MLSDSVWQIQHIDVLTKKFEQFLNFVIKHTDEGWDVELQQQTLDLNRRDKSADSTSRLFILINPRV